jgi:hypothetical protein
VRFSFYSNAPFIACITFAKTSLYETRQSIFDAVTGIRFFRKNNRQEKYAHKNSYTFVNEVFKTEYTEKVYERFTGKIIAVDSSTIQFEEKRFKISDIHPDYIAIFTEGIFYPDIMTEGYNSPVKSKAEIDSMTNEERIFYNMTRTDTLFISIFRELTDLNPDDQTKRFLFWEYKRNFMNRIEHYIELKNEKATKETPIIDFIKNARLTFYRKGTIII